LVDFFAPIASVIGFVIPLQLPFNPPLVLITASITDQLALAVAVVDVMPVTACVDVTGRD